MLPRGFYFWPELYARAGLDPSAPADPVAIAEAQLGPGCLRLVSNGERGLTQGAALCCDERGAYTIALHAGAAPERLCGLLWHEVIEWCLERRGYYEPDREHVCNAQARAGAAPEPALIAAVRELGWNLPALAERFCLSQPHMALRLAEAGGPSLAVFVGRRVVVRDRARVLPGQLELRRLLERGGDERHVVLRCTDHEDARLLVRVGAHAAERDLNT